MDGGDSLRLNSSQPLGMMVDSNSYGAAAPNDFMAVPISAGMLHGMRLSFNSMTSSAMKPMDFPVSLYHGNGMSGTRPSGVLNMGDPRKQKRGRPRKYGPDGSMALALIPRPSVSGYYNSPMSDPGTKRRGRPPGSGKKQH